MLPQALISYVFGTTCNFGILPEVSIGCASGSLFIWKQPLLFLNRSSISTRSQLSLSISRQCKWANKPNYNNILSHLYITYGNRLSPLRGNTQLCQYLINADLLSMRNQPSPGCGEMFGNSNPTSLWLYQMTFNHFFCFGLTTSYFTLKIPLCLHNIESYSYYASIITSRWALFNVICTGNAVDIFTCLVHTEVVTKPGHYYRGHTWLVWTEV